MKQPRPPTQWVHPETQPQWAHPDRSGPSVGITRRRETLPGYGHRAIARSKKSAVAQNRTEDGTVTVSSDTTSPRSLWSLPWRLLPMTVLLSVGVLLATYLRSKN